MSVQKIVTYHLPARGPGAGQRDDWQVSIPVTVERRQLKFELPPGANGKIIYIEAQDLIDLAMQLQQDRDRNAQRT